MLIVEHLIERKADVNAVDTDGNTILDLVEPNLEIANLLRKNGGKHNKNVNQDATQELPRK